MQSCDKAPFSLLAFDDFADIFDNLVHKQETFWGINLTVL
jgi:hypothetical protein